jgi:glycosyltransferase involved in cell wall biosynthesis
LKKIGICSGCYNEVDNIRPLSDKIIKIMETELPEYDYEILFIDNCSTDGTREVLEELCKGNPKIKAILNAKNFGANRSGFHAFLNSDGDCTIQMASDFQDPPEMIPQFVHKWEEGYKIVIAQKHTSKENKLMYLIRSIYYKFIKKISDVEQIEQFTGFGLYDHSFIEIVRSLNDPYPYFRGIVGEYGYKIAMIKFEQPQRRSGKSKSNFMHLYDTAMLGITSYSKVVMRMATILGFFVSAMSIIIAIVYLILKIVYWSSFPMGLAPLVIGMFFLGAIQLFFIGMLGEYMITISTKVTKRPLVAEENRFNLEGRKIY